MQDVGGRRSSSKRSHQSRGLVGLRDLMVHLNDTPEDEMWIAHAEAIATMSEAHLTGIYTNLLPDYGMVSAGDAALPSRRWFRLKSRHVSQVPRP